MKVFIIDDDSSILEIYNKFFEIYGCNVIDNATNGEEAITKFQKFMKKPDFIIMDYHMPYKNGIEATKEILEIDKTAKIVIVSGDLSIKEKALASGAMCFREKPLHISKIIQEINFLKNQKSVNIQC